MKLLALQGQAVPVLAGAYPSLSDEGLIEAEDRGCRGCRSLPGYPSLSDEGLIEAASGWFSFVHSRAYPSLSDEGLIEAARRELEAAQKARLSLVV